MTYHHVGLRDDSPDDIQHRQLLIQAMVNVVSNGGYQPVVTPVVESYDQRHEVLGSHFHECIRLNHHGTSRRVLRSDHTISIARMVTSRLADQPSVRLYYCDPVFRYDTAHGETDIIQFGVEHIGHLTIDDELDMIQMVQACCQAVGVVDAAIHLGHPALFQSCTPDQHRRLQNGDMTQCPTLPRQYRPHDIPETAPFYATARALAHRSIDAVFINDGLYKDLNYYNGIYFDVVSPSFGKIIGSGGRYDAVLKAYGSNQHAIGFSLNIHHIEGALAVCQPS